jgi:hypothetical protein
MFNKPWKYVGVLYEDEFWRYAKKTPFYRIIKQKMSEYTELDRAADESGAKRLLMNAARLANNDGGFSSIIVKVGEKM